MAAHRQFASEARILERATHSYANRLNSLIERMNQRPTNADTQEGLRLCIEVVSLVLSSQQVIAGMLSEMDPEDAPASLKATPEIGGRLSVASPMRAA